MSNIDELQRRLLSAMDRIGAGIEGLSQSQTDPGVAEALEEERLANAQLQERLKSLHKKHEEEVAALNAKIKELAELETLKNDIAEQANAMSRLDIGLQRLRKANEQLRESNAALRDANEEGVGEPHLINKAMLAELEALRAARAADTAEAEAILTKLAPLLEAGANTVEQESV